MNEPLNSRLLRAWPFWSLGLLAVVFVFMLVFSRKAPAIASLEPAMAAPGQQVVVTGDYFGRTEREGSLSLAGEIPPPSLILSWTDQKIVFVVPEDATSGLVTVSNSQGSSTGMLFTNTETIPTVLQLAENQHPLLWAASPSQPSAGQRVTLLGHGFGLGDEAAFVRVAVAEGPQLELGPAETLSWSPRSISFRWPGGTAADTQVSVVTPRGQSSPFSLGSPSPMTWVQPRTTVVEFRAKFTQPAGQAVVLWGPVPQRPSGTAWSLVSSDPSLPSGTRAPVFTWNAGSGGERQAVYKLNLTVWARQWNGLPAGTSPPSDVALDEAQRAVWKPAAAALKTLVAKWGLDTADPWLRLQRLQTGLSALGATVGEHEAPQLTRSPSELLAAGKLNSYEVSSLAVALASQAGLSARLVAGLWSTEDRLLSRTWAEVWIPAAGWVSWDVIDGNVGSLDNKHLAFDVGGSLPQRRLPRSRTFGVGAPGTLLTVAGEASGSGPEPVVQWQITTSQK